LYRHGLKNATDWRKPFQQKIKNSLFCTKQLQELFFGRTGALPNGKFSAIMLIVQTSKTPPEQQNPRVPPGNRILNQQFRKGSHSMERTKIAILGCGFIAEIHASSYARFVTDAEVVAVYSHHLDKAKTFAGEMGISAWYDDIDRLLKETDCDVVDVCLPNYLHHDACVKAASSGRHVIVEKPLCLSIAEADEMIAACKRNGKLLCTPKSSALRRSTSACATSWKAARSATSICSNRRKSTAARTAAGSTNPKKPAAA
jgi:hypothetical protein